MLCIIRVKQEPSPTKKHSTHDDLVWGGSASTHSLGGAAGPGHWPRPRRPLEGGPPTTRTILVRGVAGGTHPLARSPAAHSLPRTKLVRIVSRPPTTTPGSTSPLDPPRHTTSPRPAHRLTCADLVPRRARDHSLTTSSVLFTRPGEGSWLAQRWASGALQNSRGRAPRASRFFQLFLSCAAHSLYTEWRESTPHTQTLLPNTRLSQACLLHDGDVLRVLSACFCCLPLGVGSKASGWKRGRQGRRRRWQGAGGSAMPRCVPMFVRGGRCTPRIRPGVGGRAHARSREPKVSCREPIERGGLGWFTAP